MDMLLSQKICISEIDCLCLGSGRFLRSVLVPFLSSHSKPAVFQTRGRSFVNSFAAKLTTTIQEDVANGNVTLVPSLTYPVDTIEYSGSVSTTTVEIFAAGTIGTPSGKEALLDNLLQRMRSLKVIGLGVTEAGLSDSKNQCMVDLTLLLYRAYRREVLFHSDDKKICIINTDNVPKNGDVIREHVLQNAREMREMHSNDDRDQSNGSADCTFLEFIESKVAFLNTMVDRITSSRKDEDLIPSCEPLPKKALVICDPGNDLPSWMREEKVQALYGVKIRHHPKELDSDIALKLRVANGTHTAVAHVMALSSLVNTEALSSTSSSSTLLTNYLSSIFESQICTGAIMDGIPAVEINATWEDWRQRLKHPFFGLSTFFITQNGAAKAGIRLGPTIKALISNAVDGVSGKAENPLSSSMAVAIAATLRFFTPIDKYSIARRQQGIYLGWLDGHNFGTHAEIDGVGDDIVTYADGLRYNISMGWYEFRCLSHVEWINPLLSSTTIDSSKFVKQDILLSEALLHLGKRRQPAAYKDVVLSYLLHSQGGNLQALLNGEDFCNVLTRYRIIDEFVGAVATLYARMVSGDTVAQILQEMVEKQHVYSHGFSTSCRVLIDGVASSQQYLTQQPLHYRQCPIPDSSCLMKSSVAISLDEVRSVVFSEVMGQQVIDLHTHLLPPAHGALCLWGIDELLTYHYLVAEYFMTAPASISPEGFYAMNKTQQADLIWNALFIERSPLSEATRGVLTTLVALGLETHVEARNLNEIRRYYNKFQEEGLRGVERFTDLTFRLSGIRYAIMTNIPFEATESQHWRPLKKDYPNIFKSALRVDPLLSGDRKTILSALKASGYGTTLDDARQYLRDWCDTMKPEYLMASTPHNFSFSAVEGVSTLAGVKKSGLNEAALQSPFAFTDISNVNCKECSDDNMPSVIDEQSDFLLDVLMPVCEERNLPLALKIGAHRKLNPSLLAAGDGMVAFADTGSLARLCTRFPKVKFLATFLSRANQHEACVLANKFRNLHIYGCWWYCNNPSIIQEITRMRVEMLGTAFTAQHSDARVMDQLIYKWSHSRAIIAKVLTEEYEKAAHSGWKVSREEIRRDVWQMFGGSYSEFMKKSLN